MSKPTWDPPEGTHWELQQSVVLYDGNPSVAALNLPRGYAPDGSLHVNFDGLTSYGMGSTYGLDGAAEYAFERWIYAQFQMYVDGDATELMASEPANDSGSQCTSIFASETLSFLDTSVGHTLAWPWRWQFTWHSHSHAVDSGSLGVAVVKIVGDVWTAVLGVDGYQEISGEPPIDTPIDPCPPDCGQNIPVGTPVPPSEPPPNGVGMPPAAADEGLVVRWGRTDSRIDWRMLLGAVGGLTWATEWDGERSMVLEGLHYTATALAAGGYHAEAEYRWGKLPGTDVQGRRLWFTLDISALDDPVAVLR
jgi:hypothetical protein